MANPAPVRPWSRLASLRPTPPRIPSPPSQRPSERNGPPLVTTPRFVVASGKTSAPSSQPQKSPTPSTSLSNSSSLKPSQELKTFTMDDNVNVNAAKSPQKTTSPSPLASLPPSQLKADTEVNPKIKGAPLHSDLGKIDVHSLTPANEEFVTRENQTKEKSISKRPSNFEKSGIRVITISGENRGAYMEIFQSSKKPNFLHKKGNSKIKAHDDDHESESANRKNKNHKERTLLHSPPMSAFIINSNVQCVNNSLLYHTSCTSNDPGVKVTLSRKPFGEGFHSSKKQLN